MTQQSDDPSGESRRSDVPSGASAAEQERVQSRSELLPEERAAGSDDPEEQAKAILAESDERTDDPVATQQESVQSPNVDRERGPGGA